ncbi:unnamed protein product [Chrysoparadoxa australica]
MQFKPQQGLWGQVRDALLFSSHPHPSTQPQPFPLLQVGPFKSDPAIMAHQIISVMIMTRSGLLGLRYWPSIRGTEDRLYGVLEEAEIVGIPNLAYQVYDLAATIAIAKLCKMEMVAHHIIAVGLAYQLLRDEYCHYYAVFFLGLTELSSVPLSVVDIFKHFRELGDKYAGLNTALRLAFAVLFLLVRCIWWPLVSVQFYQDTFESFSKGTVHDTGVVLFFLVSNILLTLLQWYWGFLIVRAALKMAQKVSIYLRN